MNARTLTPGRDLIAIEAHYGARNYQPVPVVVDHARDCLVWDVDGREYLDMMSA
jgi:ornithine--oxo-acid transaminase